MSVDSDSEYLDWDSGDDNVELVAKEYKQVCRIIEMSQAMDG